LLPVNGPCGGADLHRVSVSHRTDLDKAASAVWRLAEVEAREAADFFGIFRVDYRLTGRHCREVTPRISSKPRGDGAG